MPDLHGEIQFHLVEAKDLWADRGPLERARQQCFSSSVVWPYATVRLGAVHRVIKTKAIEATDTPHWDHKQTVPVANDVSRIIVHVKAASTNRTSCVGLKIAPNKSLGYCFIAVQDLLGTNAIDGWFPLTSITGVPSNRNRGSIHLSIRYSPLDELNKSLSVPTSYFPERTGNIVRLYADAHANYGALPPIIGPHGNEYFPGTCWVDISEAIERAQHLICITGWSVYTATPLLRNGTGTGDKTIGELLKEKAEAGVTVRVLVWDELLSRESGPMAAGIMATHDEETVKFFEGTRVVAAKVGRVDEEVSWVGNLAVNGLFTHHQKTVIVDAPVTGTQRRGLVAFVGGLDICDGRWDDEGHALFRTLGKNHPESDYHQACFPCPYAYGPREPWHDVHSRVEGPLAWDVLQNFVERWKCQVKHRPDAVPVLHEQVFCDPQESARAITDNTGEPTWNVQLFRSIDTRSAALDVARDGLIDKKGRKIEASIQQAYVHNVRRAKEYIYIENQYFLGSSHTWLKNANDNANHLVPAEIALKIANKIRKRERFVAYVVLPMFPEGPPADNAVQEILHFQFRTVEMMYKKIADAIAEVRIDAHPTDYLSFFCLGVREPGEMLPIPEGDKTVNESVRTLQATRRHTIYVHSKFMIVDDEYALCGSANINQRSMDGTRDTEIAVGMYQEGLEASVGSLPRGDVSCFRKQLWAEHTGTLEPVFDMPSSVECVRRIRAMAQQNWEDYCAESMMDLTKRHLLLYPYLVDDDGTVSAERQYFPDTIGTIRGRDTPLPNILTT